MKANPIEESRRVALEAAEQLLQIEGWRALTAAKTAAACGMSRQWLHTLFGGQQQLIDALVDAVIAHWRAHQLEIMAARHSLADSVTKSFNLLLEAQPTVSVVLRQTLVENQNKQEKIRRDIDEWWMPVWNTEGTVNRSLGIAVTTIWLSSSLALEPLVRTKQVSIRAANSALVGACRGAITQR